MSNNSGQSYSANSESNSLEDDADRASDEEDLDNEDQLVNDSLDAARRSKSRNNAKGHSTKEHKKSLKRTDLGKSHEAKDDRLSKKHSHKQAKGNSLDKNVLAKFD